MTPDLSTPTIRLATPADLDAINRIYNHYVDHSTCTYAEQYTTPDERRAWFDEHKPAAHPITVAEHHGRVLGWGSLSKYHSRCAYRFTVENSVYIDPDHHRQGFGSTILSDLITRARSAGHHTIIASIDAEQAASLAIHLKFGFARVAHLSQVGFKFNRWLDCIYLQLLLKSSV